MDKKFVPQCPRCGGEVIAKDVTEILQGGSNTALLQIKAGVCLICGERLFTPDTIRLFEMIETRLEQQDTADFKPVGQVFQVTVQK